MPKVLIAYATRLGETERIADYIAEGLRMAGVEVTTRNVNNIKKVDEIIGYNGYVFGSPTYHGDMMQSMKTFLFLAENAGLAGKTGGAFGAFGWSGEAHERVYNTMKNIFKMNMVSDSLRLKSTELGGGVQMAQEYGKSVAKLLTS